MDKAAADEESGLEETLRNFKLQLAEPEEGGLKAFGALEDKVRNNFLPSAYFKYEILIPGKSYKPALLVKAINDLMASKAHGPL